MKFDRDNRIVRLDQDAERNIVLIEGQRFFLEYIDVADMTQRGRNSSVFQAVARDVTRNMSSNSAAMCWTPRVTGNDEGFKDLKGR